MHAYVCMQTHTHTHTHYQWVIGKMAIRACPSLLARLDELKDTKMNKAWGVAMASALMLVNLKHSTSVCVCDCMYVSEYALPCLCSTSDAVSRGVYVCM